MRLIIDTVIALMLVAILGGVIWSYKSEEAQANRIEATRNSIVAIRVQTTAQPALHQVEATRRGFAKKIERKWFEHLPQNMLINDASVPWLDHASETERKRENPAYIVANRGYASFWYNPQIGRVVARVPMQFTQSGTVKLYNKVNGTSLSTEDIDWGAAAKARADENEAAQYYNADSQEYPFVN